MRERKWALSRLALAAIVLSAAHNTRAAAQTSEIASLPPTEQLVRMSLEQSYVAFGAGVGTLDSLILEANIVPHLFFDLDSLRVPILGGFVSAIAFAPKINLRIFSARSAPVRAPSFMPQITLFHWSETADSVVDFWSLRVAHHSNGQDGEFLSPDGTRNRVTGSFSTNFVELGFTKATWVGGLSGTNMSLEYHPGINMTDELKTEFGRLRLNLRSSYLARVSPKSDPWLETRFEITWRGMKYPGRNLLSAKERWSTRVTWVYTHQKIRDAGLWVDYYWGPDYYNVNFDRRVSSLRVGLMFNFGGVASPHTGPGSG